MNTGENRRQRKRGKKTRKTAKRGQLGSPHLKNENLNINEVLSYALRCQSAGHLHEAEAVYHRILEYDPSQSIALHMLGVIVYQTGNKDLAFDFINRALDINPKYAEAHYNYGIMLNELGKIDQAAESFKNALDINPNYVEAHNNLGNVFRELGKLEKAATCYHAAIAINSAYAEAHYNLGNLFREMGKLEEAISSYHNAIELKSDYIEAHYNLANVFNILGKLDESVARYKNVLDLNPNHGDAQYSLGSLYRRLGKLDEAVASYKKGLTINPRSADIYLSLGVVLRAQERVDEAVECFNEALEIKPNYAEAYSNLGSTLHELGSIDDSIACFRLALKAKPDLVQAHSMLLFVEQYNPQNSAETLYELHCQWEKHHGARSRSSWPKHKNTPDPGRRLRIGFVSPNLGRHPVGYFLIRLLENLSKTEVETVAYSDRDRDDMTDRIMAATNVWRVTREATDKELIEKIADDKIDILIDLAGHTARNRLPVFACKPAPVQVTWAGYPGTTGLSAIDYLLSDAHSTHENEEIYYSEKIIRMPDGWLCYDPPQYAPKVGPLPCKESGHLTFGSFNNIAKVNTDVLTAWADILEHLPGSKLMLKYGGLTSRSNKERITSFFLKRGIDDTRLVLEGGSSHEKLLASYNRVDIALDTFPYSGGVTTLEALWMGVPVITLAGETFASRHTLSHLFTIGLPELVASDRDEYVKIVVEQANDAKKLEYLRVGLRDKMAESPICDGKKFADEFVKVMRGIWHDWCSLQQ